MSNPVSVGDDLVGDLRDCRDLRKNGALSLPAVNAYMQKVYSVRHKAADRIEALEAQLKAAREALERQKLNIDHWLETGIAAGPEESKSIYDQICAALNPKVPS